MRTAKTRPTTKATQGRALLGNPALPPRQRQAHNFLVQQLKKNQPIRSRPIGTLVVRSRPPSTNHPDMERLKQMVCPTQDRSVDYREDLTHPGGAVEELHTCSHLDRRREALTTQSCRVTKLFETKGARCLQMYTQGSTIDRMERKVSFPVKHRVARSQISCLRCQVGAIE